MFLEWITEKITNKSIGIKLKDEVIKQLQVNNSVKMLGVHVNPVLDWNDQFEYFKNEMRVTIKKLMRTEIKTYQDHVHNNVHMLSNVI